MEVDPEDIEAAKAAVVDDNDNEVNKKAAASRVALEEKVDYLKLMRHIELNHPTYEIADGESEVKNDEGEPDITYKRFGLCSDLGFLRSHCECCPQ